MPKFYLMKNTNECDIYEYIVLPRTYKTKLHNNRLTRTINKNAVTG